MKYFIGAKDKNGIAFIADMIDAENFEAAYSWLDQNAKEQKGEGNYRITACNEMPTDLIEPLFSGAKKFERGFGTSTIADERELPPASELRPVRIEPPWSMLRIVNTRVDGIEDFDIDLQVSHSTKFQSAEEMAQYPAARFITFAARIVDAVLQGNVTEDTRVLELWRSAGKPDKAETLIVSPDSQV